VRRAVEEKWSGADAAQHYAQGRFHSPRAARRDPRLVAELLRAHAPHPTGFVLDAPCGTGRLAPVLTGHGTLVGLDANRPMLERAAGAGSAGGWVQGSALALPFADRSFDAVVCCRLLHHLRDRGELERGVRELVRVSRRLVVASFWDAASWPALRVRLGLKRDEGPEGRGDHPCVCVGRDAAQEHECLAGRGGSLFRT